MELCDDILNAVITLDFCMINKLHMLQEYLKEKMLKKEGKMNMATRNLAASIKNSFLFHQCSTNVCQATIANNPDSL